MRRTPKALRVHIGIFGRTNVGKSTFLNYVTSQDVAITSPLPGTTTDVVEKAMELLPLGPVLFLDTAGIDDVSALSEKRLGKTKKIFERSDIFVLVTEADTWGHYESAIAREAERQNAPLIVIINKKDIIFPGEEYCRRVSAHTSRYIIAASTDTDERERVIHEFKRHLIEVCPDDCLNPPPLIGDLVPPGEVAVLIVPIDLEAPKGRLILPQVQVIRDALDHDAATLVVKEREYAALLESLHKRPRIAVCDSQVVMKMVADTPADIPCTTFSILFARLKGSLMDAARAVSAIDNLKKGDTVLIAESCSHHPIQDDIGRVKIPRWLRHYTGLDLSIETCAGRDFPDNLETYSLIIQCGGCMITRREMLARCERAREAGVPMTNYGICISFVQGVLERVLSPFPAAHAAYAREKTARRNR